MKPKYIVLHTAAYSGRNCDSSVIDNWHKQRGWQGIGYHYVILNDRHDYKPDGTLETGRKSHIAGAHCLGINDQSIGICCIGHGDKKDFTEKQYARLIKLCHQLMTEYQIPLENVIGHKEINILVNQGKVSSRYRTTKSCPGKLVNMDNIRQLIKHYNTEQTISPDSFFDQEVADALLVLQSKQYLFPNAIDEFTEFSTHPEMLALVEKALPR